MLPGLSYMLSHIGKAKHFHRQRYPSENDLPDLKNPSKKIALFRYLCGPFAMISITNLSFHFGARAMYD